VTKQSIFWIFERKRSRPNDINQEKRELIQKQIITNAFIKTADFKFITVKNQRKIKLGPTIKKGTLSSALINQNKPIFLVLRSLL